MLIDINRLRSPLGHEYLSDEGHEDDDHCSSVLNNGEQCGQARGAHYAPDVVMEYLDVMERRLEDPAQDVGHDIAGWFGLSYSNFLVLHRVLLEGMPRWWQADFVARLEQLHASYSHLRHPEGYEVHPCRYVEVRELSDAERKSAGITSTRDDLPPPPARRNPTEEEFTAYEAAYEAAYDNEVFYDANGNELGRWQRVPIRVPDPIPHYRHGRVEPRLPEETPDD